MKTKKFISIDDYKKLAKTKQTQQIKTEKSVVNKPVATNTQIPKQSIADEFIKASNEIQKQKDNFKPKIFWSSTGAIAGLVPLVGGLIFGAIKKSQYKKAGNNEALKNLKKNTWKYVALGCAIYYPIALGLQYLFSLNKDKNLQELKDNFEQINKEKGTGAKFSSVPFDSHYIISEYNFISGNSTFSYRFINDPIFKIRQKRHIKHDLAHANQAEIVACSKDGIKKLNYACACMIVNRLDKNPEYIQVWKAAYDEIQQDTTGKYDNVEINVETEKVNLKKYLKAINTITDNRNATIDDVPIFINEQHYNEVRAKRGKLTPEEEAKAQQYFEAMQTYKTPGFFESMNPWSAYYKNLIIQEAYKESPTLISRLAAIINK